MRPKDWENPHIVGDAYTGRQMASGKSEVYEAGADAMLEALKKEALLFVDELAEGSCIDWHRVYKEYPHKKGWLVFIEEKI